MRGRPVLLCVAALGLVVIGAARGAAAWPGPPAPKPPTHSGQGPPPAWIETHATSRWLAFSSYCWKTTCADYIPPAMRPGLPVVRVPRRTSVRIHLAFAPRELRVTQLVGAGKTFVLEAARVVEWTPPAAGVIVVETRAAAGSASYVARIRAV